MRDNDDLDIVLEKYLKEDIHPPEVLSNDIKKRVHTLDNKFKKQFVVIFSLLLLSSVLSIIQGYFVIFKFNKVLNLLIPIWFFYTSSLSILTIILYFYREYIWDFITKLNYLIKGGF